MASDPKRKPPKSVCPEKLDLLHEYVLRLDIHNVDVREYAAYVTSRLDGDGLEALKRRVAESKDRFRDARKNYADHLREHDC